MKRKAFFVWIIICFSWNSYGQKIGIVLSGGGAKGLAHVGVLKALEENEIPIDYIVGTSMGGIIGGCYAAGMSPEQIESIVLSEDFVRLINGRLEDGYNYYYSKNDDNSSFVRLNLSLDSTLNVFWNSSIANDQSLNFALAEKLAIPSAISKNNFDSLFVPLRVVAADIFTQNVVVLDHGVLSDALRATQTVPFFYNPIRVDGKYLFDGGVYNNFPIDIAQKTFKPDVIIGSNVSTKIYEEYPYKEDDKLISRSLLYMLLDKSDPSEVPDNGVYIQPNLKGYSSFDFGQAKSMIDSGYAQTMRQMEVIKAKVASRRTCESVAEARNNFNSKGVPFAINSVSFEGFNSKQRLYLNRFFQNRKRKYNFRNIKDGYFKLVSEDYFKNIYPSFAYNTAAKGFDFRLTKRPQNNFQVDFGGVMATRSISNIFLGLNYYYFDRALIHSTLNFYAGNFYKAAQAKARIDFPNFGQFYFEPQAAFNSWDYLEGRDVVIKRFSPTVLNRIDRKVGLSVGIPAGKRFRAAVYSYYVNNLDRYIDTNVLVSSDTLDELKLRGFRTGLEFSSSNLDRKQYASRGRSYMINLDWFSLKEDFAAGSTSVLNGRTETRREWFRARVTAEQYFRKGFYSSGYYFDGVISNQPVFSNYQGTLINAPAFNPIQDSKTLLLQNFRAFNYLAGGWRNVFSFRNNLDLRLEGYLFKPLQAIVIDQNQEAALTSDFTKLYFAATAGLVLHTTVGPVSLSVNYYDDAENELGVLLHVGFLLYNKASLE